MAVLIAITRSLGKRCAKRSTISISSHNFRFQTLRTLVLEPSLSQSVNLRLLSHYDTEIVEINLDRSEEKNALENDMLKGLRHAFEAINQDSSAGVFMLSSSVPNVFCTDLMFSSDRNIASFATLIAI
ncbi:hypothetical protein V6N11_010813 [Hibiscus sabdariffa]|uniref:Uncharacterized protein n=1 Tax=Hibiscus sabdariffa TaxID=183260 RepID=A0ABR2S751_9ROSI